MNKNSKISLKVKSGPGEIVGITELDLENNSVNFENIQFTEPGEYIISVIPSNTDELNQTEFNIKINPEEPFIPQDDSNDVEENKITGTRPIIEQILQPSINLDPMEFEITKNDTDDSNIASSLGYTPFLWYNGTEIRSSDIKKMFLYYEDIIPKCKVVINDTLGLINNPKTTPLNDTKFEIFLNSGSDILKSIHLRFKLEFNKKNKNKTNTLTGIIDLDGFYEKKFKSYNNLTSFELIKKVSKDIGLGYNSNINSTNDLMSWRMNNKNTQKFLKEVIKHSYISDNSFLLGYIDFFWCMNFIDIEKEWNRDNDNDVGLNTMGVSSLSEKEILPMILCNDESFNSTPFYFMNDYNLSNNSTYQTVNSGFFTKSKVYDRKKKQFLRFDIDSLSSDTRDNIILKGAPGDNSNIETNFISSYSGKIDTDNVHKDFHYSEELNKRNLINLNNITVDLKLPNPNYNLYLYQKITINFINQMQTVSNEKIFDERLSGKWLIIDISFAWINGTLIQRVKAARKELGKTKEEKQTQVIEPNKSINNSEINNNPVDSLPIEGINDFNLENESIQNSSQNFVPEDLPEDPYEILLEEENTRQEKIQNEKNNLISELDKLSKKDLNLSIREKRSYFNTQYIETIKQIFKKLKKPNQNINLLTEGESDKLAKMVWDSKGVGFLGGVFSDDDEDKIGKVFNSIKQKVDISIISKSFKRLYNQDMWFFIIDFLSEKEIKKYILNYTKTLPEVIIIES